MYGSEGKTSPGVLILALWMKARICCQTFFFHSLICIISGINEGRLVQEWEPFPSLL